MIKLGFRQQSTPVFLYLKVAAVILLSIIAATASLSAAASSDAGAQSMASGSSQAITAPLRKDDLSLGLAFGAQAGPFGRESAGFRYGISDGTWGGLFLQASLSEKTKQRALGVHVEFGLDLVRYGRSILSLVPVFAYGVSENAEKDENLTQWGAALGLQIEVFLLPEVSTALKIEFGGQFEPVDEMRLSTSSSELLLFYHL